MSTEQEQQQDGNPPVPKENDHTAGEVISQRNEEESRTAAAPPKDAAAAEGTEAPQTAGEVAQPSDAGAPEVAEEAMPVPVLPDIRSILSDDSGVFDQTGDPLIATRVGVVKGLIEKHIEFMRKYSSELESGVNVDPAVIAALEEAKGRRDALNSEVASLKERRTALKEENKALRKGFIELLDVKDIQSDNAKKIEEEKRFIERQDYKLMTEGVSLEAERNLMRDIKEATERLRALSGGATPEETREKMGSLNERMHENFALIEDAHQKMLGLVAESQQHHQRFVEESKKVREAEARRAYLQRRIALHGEMQKFWETQLQNAEAMDAAETGRTTESLRDRLLKEMEEAAKAEEQARKQRRPEAGPGAEDAPSQAAHDESPAPSDGPEVQVPAQEGPGPEGEEKGAPEAVPDMEEGGSA